ncbi:MAG TPA: 50S ribosomal protein L23 [Candidatus Paceibacterota bacterium]|nr:50S ribosomal protein L23 [Candidatus Paceibacterota bacterium]
MRSNRLLIKKPWISEKSTDMTNLGKYVFAVEPNAVASEIAKAVESIYKVHVVNTNVINKVSKGKKTKKVIVTLKAGEKIDIVPH